MDSTYFLIAVYEGVKCNLMTDVTFAVGFLSESDFSLAKVFMKQLAGRFNVSTSSLQMSVVQFGRDADLAVKLKDATSQRDFTTAVNQLKFSGRAESIKSALKTAYQQSFSTRNGMRNRAEQILIVITNVQSIDPKDARESLMPYQEAGIKVIIISTDKQIIPTDLINNGVELLTVKSLGALDSEEVLDETSSRVCHGAGKSSRDRASFIPYSCFRYA